MRVPRHETALRVGEVLRRAAPDILEAGLAGAFFVLELPACHPRELAVVDGVATALEAAGRQLMKLRCGQHAARRATVIVQPVAVSADKTGKR